MLLQQKLSFLRQEIDSIIVWQVALKRDIIIALLAGGHILLEWAPGLGKTLTVKTFAEALDMSFQRIQFTPDLLPSDLLGAKIYNPESRSFEIKKWPIFAHFVLADEINRSPSKVQSALLEAMEEKQVTLGEQSFILEKPFMVLATQNPIEQEGTYNLPEAQLDRFLLKTLIEYPSPEQEIEIMKWQQGRLSNKIQKVLSRKDVFLMQEAIEKVYVSESIYTYIRDLVLATRTSGELKKWISYGASPRASLGLLQCSKIVAFLAQRDFVTPEDVQEIVYWVLRHRIVLSYEALADDIHPDFIIAHILAHTPIVPWKKHTKD
jgi:MoxR-like ATPase